MNSSQYLQSKTEFSSFFCLIFAMESSLSQIQALITQIKQHIFSPFDPLSFVSPSAYDTAWLAMIPDHPKQGITTPKFKVCLDWIVNNQKEEGFWGEDPPTIDCLPSTLACIVALKTWGVGEDNIGKGLAFIHANSSMLLKENCDDDHRLPRWFAIVFPAMIELAQATGVEVIFPKDLQGVISNIFVKRQQILQSDEEDVDKSYYPPLLAYCEALPPSYIIDEDEIKVKLSGDGSLYQSPSATARAFLVTRNQKCIEYLEALVERCPNGVPNTYPVDGELIRLCLVNQIQRLGLAEHFTQEIDEILEVVYRDHKNRELKEITEINLVAARIYKDSLAFRLFRLHGYTVTSRSFCWFIYDEDIRGHMERKFEYFTSALYNVYRATDLMFSGESELEEAGLFSKKLLQKSLKLTSIKDNPVIFPNFQMVIEHELSQPWIARLDHLDHRMWIEKNKVDKLLIGKDSFHRLSCLLNDELMQLAVENYNFRQSIYKTELEELSRWSKEWGLSEMGFGREKTAYCYFAIASSTCLPLDSPVRIIIAKSAILVTVADDFFDMEGCLDDLQTLTQAVQRWDGEDLSGHGKIIFRALNNIVSEIAENHIHQQGSDITKNLRDLWGETFGSWMMETTWSKTGYVPSLDEYLQVGITSIATHTMILPALCFLNYDLKSDHYEIITQLLMASCRLLNDIQSYQKELEVGKKNFVILYSKEINPKAGLENSINHVKGMLDEMKRELLEHALMDGFNVLPKTCNHFHVSILRVFYMFFNSSNVFDSTTELLHDINKAIYDPIG